MALRAVVRDAVRKSLYRLGFALIRVPAAAKPRDGQGAGEGYRRVLAELQHCIELRAIHRRDAAEIEELYRRFVFPDLPRSDGRAALLHQLIGTTIGEAIYIVRHLHLALKVPGDICEFGVAQGATSRLLAAELMPTDRTLWLFDSFEGLPAPSSQDELIDDIFNLGSIEKYQGTMACPESEVLEKLDAVGFPRTRARVKKGWVKDALKSDDVPSQVAFAYVDFDFFDPIRDALEFLDRRMPPGGRIVVDDYGFFSAGAQRAVDQFVAAAGRRFEFELPLPFAGHFCVLTKVREGD
jgi:hypothetical protein